MVTGEFITGAGFEGMGNMVLSARPWSTLLEYMNFDSCEKLVLTFKVARYESSSLAGLLRLRVVMGLSYVLLGSNDNPPA